MWLYTLKLFLTQTSTYSVDISLIKLQLPLFIYYGQVGCRVSKLGVQKFGITSENKVHLNSKLAKNTIISSCLLLQNKKIILLTLNL